MKKDGWWLRSQWNPPSFHEQNSERAVCTLKLTGFVWWELQCLRESSPSLQILQIEFRVLRGKKNHLTPNTEAPVLFWGSSVPCWSVKWLPQYFYSIYWASGDFSQSFLWGEIKISRKTTYITPFICLQWRLDLSFICCTGAAPVSRRCPGRSRLRIPPLFCGRNSPWRGHVFHTPGECRAGDRSPCAAACGGEHCSTSFLAF